MRICTFLIMLILIGWSAQVLACNCPPDPKIQTRRQLAEYDFIARVKITQIDSAAGYTKRLLYHKIDFKLLELFKGFPLNELRVSGGHLSLNRQTSCDLGEALGEEWVLFASYSEQIKKITTHLCTLTYRYRDTDGHLERRYDTQQKNLEILRKLFNKPVQTPTHEGYYVERYASGEKSSETTYVNGKLQGERLLWYPDGTLESRQNFREGLREGVFLWYTRLGQLETREKFKNGHSVDTTTHWFSTDTTGQLISYYSTSPSTTNNSPKKPYSSTRISVRHIYNQEGRIMSSVNFSPTGNITSESFYDPKTRIGTIRYYHTNGLVSSEVYRKNWIGPGSYIDWNEHGQLVQTGKINANGAIIRRSVKHYNSRTSSPD